MCGAKPLFLYTGEPYSVSLVSYLNIVVGIVLILRIHSHHQSTSPLRIYI